MIFSSFLPASFTPNTPELHLCLSRCALFDWLKILIILSFETLKSWPPLSLAMRMRGHVLNLDISHLRTARSSFTYHNILSVLKDTKMEV